MAETPSLFRRAGTAIRWCWRALDFTRRALLNLLLLVLLAGLAFSVLRSTPPLKDRTTLVIGLAGPIREQFTGSLRDNALSQLGQRPQAQTRLRDVLAVMEAASRDPHIERALLLTDEFSGAGPATLHEVAAAIERFKERGKPVIAWATGYDQRQYFLAAHASEVWLDPMGGVEITGFGGWRNYYKDALDKLGITAHVLRAGQYKNAGESFVASAPSKQTLEADGALYGDLWQRYTTTVERARKLGAGSLQQGIDHLPEALVAAGGDSAKLALDSHLVDALKTREELRSTLIERGVRDDKTFRQISFGAYAGRIKNAAGPETLAVIVAEGSIVDGDAPGGTVGGRSTAELIRQAREDDHVRAVVLRVNSPGGSAFGAELIRRELALTRAAGKPVVVSMGDLAASGGYWISLAADELIADASTITGSIGVIAMLPSGERALDKLGIHTGGVQTSWRVGGYDPRRGLDPRMAQVIQAGVDHTYLDFTTRAAAARKTSREAIDAVGQGRVWTGAQALERGLVDRTGSLADALVAAAQRAKLPPQHRVQYLEREPGRLERLAAMLAAQVTAWMPDSPLPWSPLPLPPALRDAREDLQWLAGAGVGTRPFTALTHCLCTPP